MSLIFTRSITLTIAIGTSEKTATHDSDPSVQSLLVCTVSPDGDSSRYGQVVHTRERPRTNLQSPRCYQLVPIPHRAPIYISNMNRLQNPKQKHISICASRPKAEHDRSGTTVRKRGRYASYRVQQGSHISE